MSVKVNSQDTGRSHHPGPGHPRRGLPGREVINVSVTPASTPALRVGRGLRAEPGRRGRGRAAATTGPTTGRGPFYPASYPGCCRWARWTATGRWPRSPTGSSQGGGDRAGREHGQCLARRVPDAAEPGTSFATAFVSGVAALVRSRYPRLSAAQVVARIEATADGGAGPGTGSGLVNPVQAVTALLAPGAAPSPAPAPRAVSVSRMPPPDRRPARRRGHIAVGSLGVVAAGGRRRAGDRPGPAAPLAGGPGGHPRPRGRRRGRSGRRLSAAAPVPRRTCGTPSETGPEPSSSQRGLDQLAARAPLHEEAAPGRLGLRLDAAEQLSPRPCCPT